MTRLAAVLLFVTALPAQARDCLLMAQQNFIMTGPCDVGFTDNGSFAIRDHRGLGNSQVIVTGQGVGEATWFPSEGVVIPLGTVLQGGPTYPYPGYSIQASNPNCWIGSGVTICQDW